MVLVRGLTPTAHLQHIFALSVFEDFVYWTDWERNSIERYLFVCLSIYIFNIFARAVLNHYLFFSAARKAPVIAKHILVNELLQIY